MKHLVRMGVAASAAGLLAVGLLTAMPRERAFPHERHAGLFPVCEGCHAGIRTGDREAAFPTRETCAGCHDGARRPAVRFTPPRPRASNLRFSHPVHERALAGEARSVACQGCHANPTGAPVRMNVAGPQPSLCIGCHAHRASQHLAADARCERCHVPLAEAGTLPLARVASLPQPPTHAAADFLSRHGRDATAPGATCAVCHARRTCERCHANADRLPAVQALSPDARVDSLERGREPTYPRPPSHDGAEWRTTHGAAARRAIASCANCHTRPSCTSCHMTGSGGAGRVIAALPAPVPGAATGVLAVATLATVHPPDMALRHGTVAAAGALQCTECHSRQTCAACHAGSDSRAFHAANYVERHATDVFAAAGSCQSCHSTETFCRDCHARVGVASRSGMNGAFHTAQPTWVLSHGSAARSGMEACASCHRQNDCVRCHSALGGWGVNPHGRDFSPGRLSARNASSCRWCHSTMPGGGA